MAILPVTYVTSAASQLSSTGGNSSQGEINIAAVTTDAVNPCYVLALHAYAAASMDTDPLEVWTTDFVTQDTDWKIVWSAGANIAAEPGFIYFKTNPGTTAAYAAGFRLNGTGAGLQYWRVSTFKNVRQMPACDVIVPTTDVQGATSSSPPHSYTVAPYSSDAAWLVYYNNAYLNQDLPDYTPDTDMTEIYDYRSIFDAGSDFVGLKSGMHWGNRDTDWTVLKANFSATALGATRTAVFQIYPYEVVLTELDGTLTFTGDVNREFSITRFLAGTLSFTQGVLVTVKQWKIWTTAIIRMWLAPTADPIELDVGPKGFTDIGES